MSSTNRGAVRRENERFCHKCKTLKQISEFVCKSGKEYNRSAGCRTCKSAKKAEWRSANKETNRRSQKEWREKNRVKMATYMRAYRASHIDLIKAIKRRTYYKHYDTNALHKANRKARLRASKKNSFRPLKISEWRAIKARQNHLCAYCGDRASLTIEHVMPIILGGLHEAANIVAACKSCNSKKGRKHPDIFAKEIGRESLI